jgi:hypothetical protein
MEACYAAVERSPPTVDIARAVASALRLAESGQGLGGWPAFLRVLARHDPRRYAEVVAPFASHEVTEVRRAAFGTLVAFAERTPDVASTVGVRLRPAATFAARDPDPGVRRGARRLAVLSGAAEAVSRIPDASHLVPDAIR